MRRQAEEKEGVPMSSLIDIVFLLIIFFVLTASLQQEVIDFKIQLAESQYVKPPKENDPRTFTLNIRKPKQNEEGFPAPIYSVAGTTYQLDQIRNMLMREREKHGDSMTVIIRVSNDLEYKEVDKVNVMINEVGIATIAHASLSKYKE